MLIPPEEAKLFFNLYPSLIGYVASRSGGVGGITDIESFRSASHETKAQLCYSLEYWVLVVE